MLFGIRCIRRHIFSLFGFPSHSPTSQSDYQSHQPHFKPTTTIPTMTSDQQPNTSLQTIPLAFGLALTPHLYSNVHLMLATQNTQSVAMPRTNLEAFKASLPKDLWNHLARARGAHLNSLEVFPLYAAAIVAGNLAKLPAEDLSGVWWSFLSARVVYMGLYLGVKNDVMAYVSFPSCWLTGGMFADLWYCRRGLARMLGVSQFQSWHSGELETRWRSKHKSRAESTQSFDDNSSWKWIPLNNLLACHSRPCIFSSSLMCALWAHTDPDPLRIGLLSPRPLEPRRFLEL